jgi:hypothetical protein
MLPPPGIESRIPSRPTRTALSTPTELPRVRDTQSIPAHFHKIAVNSLRSTKSVAVQPVHMLAS